MDDFNNSAVQTPKKVSKIRIIVILLFILSAISTVAVLLVYHNKMTNNKLSTTVEGITLARPVVNTYDLPQAKVGEKYQTLVFATVDNFNTQIEAEIVSGLPKGLQLLNPCKMEFNSPTVKYSKVSSLAKCTLVGVPEQSGNYQVRILFSVPGGNINAVQDIPLLVNP